MKYVDSNVFIYPVIYDEKMEIKASIAKKILIEIARGSIRAATVALSWDELVWVIREVLGVKVAKAHGRKFLQFPNLRLLSVDEKTIMEAQRLVEKYSLKPRDAIHAGCAIKNGIKEIITDDSDFDKIEEIKRIKLDEALRNRLSLKE